MRNPGKMTALSSELDALLSVTVSHWPSKNIKCLRNLTVPVLIHVPFLCIISQLRVSELPVRRNRGLDISNMHAAKLLRVKLAIPIVAFVTLPGVFTFVSTANKTLTAFGFSRRVFNVTVEHATPEVLRNKICTRPTS